MPVARLHRGSDATAGSDVTLKDRGMYPLKGIDGDWQLLAVARS
jgi:hypothetical protein